MPKIYTKVKGAVLEIGHYGSASNDIPAEVPERVAVELEDRADLRIERLPSAAAPRETEAVAPYRRRR